MTINSMLYCMHFELIIFYVEEAVSEAINRLFYSGFIRKFYNDLSPRTADLDPVSFYYIFLLLLKRELGSTFIIII